MEYVWLRIYRVADKVGAQAGDEGLAGVEDGRNGVGEPDGESSEGTGYRPETE